MESLTDVLTGEAFRNPVMLACGHSFSQEPLFKWWETKQQRLCPMCRHESAPEFQPIPNFTLAALTEETARQKQQLYFLFDSSTEHIKPGLRLSSHYKEVHTIRLFLFEMIKTAKESVVLFGGTIVEQRLISREIESSAVNFLDGAPVSKKMVFSPDTDIDLAFKTKADHDSFLAALQSRLTVTIRSTGSYSQLPGLQVTKVFAAFFRNRKADRLRIDLVFLDEGHLSWPDFAERMVACDLKEPHYLINPLLSTVFYQHLLTGGTLLENSKDRLVRNLLRRIDDNAPLQWCLLSPDTFASFFNTDISYHSYVTSMLGRLAKALRRGSQVVGITISYDRTDRAYLMPCGHRQCQPARLSDIDYVYNKQTESINVVCSLQDTEHLFFKQFWSRPSRNH